MYRGIRSRSGKWVSEIREPRKTTRIWLGTYPTPEMAAAAYDVAAIALKGHESSVPLNFPEMVDSYPIAVSTSANDIRAAAASAAALKQPQPTRPEGINQVSSSRPSVSHPAPAGGLEIVVNEEAEGKKEGDQDQEVFVDEEELLNMPSLLADMAEGMMVRPPRINEGTAAVSDDSDVETLWSYP